MRSVRDPDVIGVGDGKENAIFARGACILVILSLPQALYSHHTQLNLYALKQLSRRLFRLDEKSFLHCQSPHQSRCRTTSRRTARQVLLTCSTFDRLGGSLDLQSLSRPSRMASCTASSVRIPPIPCSIGIGPSVLTATRLSPYFHSPSWTDPGSIRARCSSGLPCSS